MREELPELPQWSIELALNFYGAYPDEIDECIAADVREEMAARLEYKQRLLAG